MNLLVCPNPYVYTVIYPMKNNITFKNVNILIVKYFLFRNESIAGCNLLFYEGSSLNIDRYRLFSMVVAEDSCGNFLR